MKLWMAFEHQNVADSISVDVGDPPAEMSDEAFLLRLARHLRFHEMSLPMIATALDLERNRMGKLMIAPGGTPQNRAAEEIRKLAIKYDNAAAEDTVDQLVRTIRAMEGK
jgi:hypothetical protein